MNESEEWLFRFGLINQEDDLVSYEEAERLMEVIVAWAEERGYGIGGGFTRGLPIGEDRPDLFDLKDE